MSFSFTASGSREETLTALRALDFTDTHADQLGAAARDLLARAVEDGAEARYSISAWGHVGPGSAPTLNVTLATTTAPPG